MTATFKAFDGEDDRAMTAKARVRRDRALVPFGVLSIKVDGSYIDIFTTPERAQTIADAINNSAPAKLDDVA